MPALWMPGAVRVPGNNGLGLGRVHHISRYLTWHTFEAPYTYARDIRVACRYLNTAGSTPTFAYHPITGEVGQMLPANQGCRTLKAAGAETNRVGRIHIQVEVIAYASRPWTLDLTPEGLAGLRRLMNFVRSWGVPDQWAWYGQPPPEYPGSSVRRRYPNQPGHAYHSGWPVNDHGDPGKISRPWQAIASGPPNKTPNPNLPYTKAEIKTAQRLLAGFDLSVGEIDGIVGTKTVAATKQYQRYYGEGSLTVDGIPGPATVAHMEETMGKIEDLTRDVGRLATKVDGIPDAVRKVKIGARGVSLESWVRGGNLKAGRAQAAAREANVRAETAVELLTKMAGDVNGLRAAVDELAKNNGIDAEELREIAEKGSREGVEQALQSIETIVSVRAAEATDDDKIDPEGDQ